MSCCSAGTGVEVFSFLDLGEREGGVGCGERPLACLPLPQLFLFFGAFVAENLTQEGLSFGPGLGSAREEVGLTKGLHFLKIDC